MDSFATAISLALQYGVPLPVLADKFSHTRFEPSGFTGNPQLPIAKSIVDYIFRWLALKFLPSNGDLELEAETKPEPQASAPTPQKALPAPGPKVEKAKSRPAITALSAIQGQADAPPCHTCGSIMVRSGACYKCVNCGSTSGCS
jgi:ribonucleoside-diphosphate reductase alpha chain